MGACELMTAAGRAVGARGVFGAALVFAGAQAMAGPEGEEVLYGWAEFLRDGSLTTIRVSDLAIIRYDAFDVASWETIRFLQPGADSRVLNRIDSAMPTFINGQIQSNGQVYFVNPAGIFFGEGAVVDVGGIYAAAGHVSDSDFLSGVNNFTGLSGEVVNRGTINASGSVGLIGRRVANFGQVVAGDVVTMAAGDEVLIGERGGHVFARVTGAGENTGGPATQIGVENHGVIRAGDQVVLGVGDHFALALFDTSEIYAQAVDIKGKNGSHIQVAGTIDATGDSGGRVHVLGDYISIDNATIDASGETGGGAIRIGGGYQGSGSLWRAKGTWIGEGVTLRADALTQGDGGAIIVWADGATGFSGQLSARGGLLGGDGGFAEVSGKGWLSFNGGVDLTAANGRKGTLLLDPTNIRVFDGPAGAGDVDSSATNADFIFGAADADPGDMETSISNTDLVTLLDSADIVLQANNDILFEGSVDASGNTGDHSLTLNAGRSIVISDNVSIFLRGAFVATINDVNATADRGAGAGAFTMGANSVIRTTFGAADGLISIESQDGRTGAELAGDFTLGTLDAGSAGISLTVTGNDGSASFLAAGGGASLTGGSIELNNALVGGTIGASGGAISITSPLLAAASSDDVFLSFVGSSALGTVGGTSGVTSSGGSVDLASTGTLTVNQGVSSGGGGDVTIDAADLVVNAAIAAGAGDLTITSSGDIELGVASGAGGVMVVSNAELAMLSGASLRVGTLGVTQSVRVEGLDGGAGGGDVLAGFGGGAISIAGMDVSFAAASSVFTNLEVDADNSISILFTLTTETGGMDFGTADMTIGANVDIDSAGAVVMGDATLTGVAGAVGITSADGFGITIGNVTATSGSDLGLFSGDSIAAGSISLGTGEFGATIDGGAAGATSSSFGAISAEQIVLFAFNDASISLNGDLTSSAGQVAIDASAGGLITLGGDISATGGAVTFFSDLNLNADIVTAGTSVTFMGDVLLGGAGSRSVTITGGAGLDLIDFQADLDAAAGQGLTLDAGTGGIALGSTTADDVGLAGALGDILIAGAGAVNVAGSVNAASLTAGTVGSVDTFSFLGVGETITLSGVNGTGRALELVTASGIQLDSIIVATSVSGGDIRLDAGAGGIAVATNLSMTTTGGVTLLSDLAVTGDIDVTLGSDGSAQSGSFAGLMGDDITISGGGGALTLAFAGAIDSAGAGGVVLDATAGGGLTFNAGSSITTTGGTLAGEGGVDLTGFVTLATNLTIDTSAAGAAGGGITLSGAVNADTAGLRALNLLSGDADITVASIGGTRRLDSLMIDAGTGTIAFRGTTIRAEGQDYTAALYDFDTLGGSGNYSLNGNGAQAGNIVFNTGVIAIAAGHNLSLSAPNGNVTLVDVTGAGSDLTVSASGTVTLAQVGTGGARLDQILITGDEIELTNSLFGSGSLTLRTSTLGQDIEVAGAVDLGASTLDLTLAELAFIEDGFSSITIGRSGGTGDLGFHGFTFLDSVALVTRGGITIDGLLATSTGGDSITLGDSSSAIASVTLDVGGATVTTNAGDLDIFGSLALMQDSVLDTGAGAGDVMVSGATNAVGAGLQSLTVTAGTGSVDLGVVGSTTALSALSVSGDDVTLDGIGTSGASGVTGAVGLTAGGTLSLGGTDYHAGSQTYAATTGTMLLADTAFRTTGAGALMISGGDISLSGFSLDAITAGGDVTFSTRVLGSGGIGEDLLINAMGGAVTLDDVGTSGARLASVEVRGGTVSLSDVFTHTTGAATGDQTFVGDLTLASTYDSNGGDILFDGDVLGLSAVVIDAGTGRVEFTGNSISAPSFDLRGAFYDLTGTGTVSFGTTAGDLVFTDGFIRLMGPSTVNFTAFGGAGVALSLEDMIANGTEDVFITTSGTATLEAIGASLADGVAELTVTASEVDLLGVNEIWAPLVVLRPFGVSQDIVVAGGTSAGTFDITAAELATLHGLDRLVIGRSDYTGTMTLNALTLNALLELRAPTASALVRVLGDIGITGNHGIFFDIGAPLDLRANITALGGQFESTDDVQITGDVNINTGNGDILIDGVFDGFSDGVGDLTLMYGSGSLSFLNATKGYGINNRLASLTVMGDTIAIPGAYTTGDQMYMGGITLLGPASPLVESASGSITFDGPVTLMGDTLVRILSGSGAITFTGSLIGSGPGVVMRLDAGASGSVDLGSVGTASKEIDSLIVDALLANFRGDVNVDDQIVINATTRLDAALDPDNVLLFCGQDVTFNGSLISRTTGVSGLEVRSPGTTSFLGSVGQGAGRLRSVVTNAPGMTVIAGDMSTQLGMTFGDDVLIAGTPTLRSYDTGVAGSIRFLKTVNADGTPGRTLTVITDRSLGDLINGSVNPDLPVIQFVGDIGTAVGGELDELNLNYSLSLGIDDRMFVPVASTIVFGDIGAFLGSGATRDFIVNVGSLNMGRGEKIGVLGALDLNASVSARLGDITAAGDIFIDTPALTILLRDAGNIFDPLTLVAGMDDGVDFVSGGTQIVINTPSITLDGAGEDPSFTVTGGNVTVPGDFEIRSFQETVTDLMTGVVVLDVRSAGPTNTNVAEAIAAAVPRESQTGVVQEDTTVGLAAQEVLRELGIYPRASLTDPRLTEAQRDALLESVLESLLGMAVYNDMPGQAAPEFTEVTVDRLELDLVNEILADYRSLFRAEIVDEQTGELVIEDRRGQVRSVLEEVVILYFETLEPEAFDADQFMAFMEEQGEPTAEALEYVLRLRELFARIRLLGLSSREVAGVKSALFGAVRPGDLTTSELETLLDPESAPAAP